MSKNTITDGGQRGEDLPHVDRLKVSPSSVVSTLQRTNTKNSKQILPEEELRGHSPNFPLHVSVSDLFIPTIDLPILLQEIYGPILEYKNRSQTHECGNWD
jgi:hypothetical protein